MNREKREYEAPDIIVKRVELESSICNGSVDLEAQSPGVKAASQDVNTDFWGVNDFSNADWNDVSSSSSSSSTN